MANKHPRRTRIKTRKPTAPPSKVFRDRSREPHRKQKHKKPVNVE